MVFQIVMSIPSCIQELFPKILQCPKVFLSTETTALITDPWEAQGLGGKIRHTCVRLHHVELTNIRIELSYVMEAFLLLFIFVCLLLQSLLGDFVNLT